MTNPPQLPEPRLPQQEPQHLQRLGAHDRGHRDRRGLQQLQRDRAHGHPSHVHRVHRRDRGPWHVQRLVQRRQRLLRSPLHPAPRRSSLARPALPPPLCSAR